MEVRQNSEESALVGQPTGMFLTPFVRIRDNFVVVGSITEERRVLIDGAAKYQLFFELLPHGVQDDKKFENGIRLRFMKDDHPVFAIRRANNEMDTSSQSDLLAQPAE